jgi:hypothetical protein
VPAALGGLTALRTLYIGGNQLTSVPAEWEKDGALTNVARRSLGGGRGMLFNDYDYDFDYDNDYDYDGARIIR